MVRLGQGPESSSRAFWFLTAAPDSRPPGPHAADWARSGCSGCSDWLDFRSDWSVSIRIGQLLKLVGGCTVPVVTPHPCIHPRVFFV